MENNKVNTIDLAAATTANSTTTVVFTVIAPDGKTSKTYTVDIARPAANASNNAYATNIKVGTIAVDNFNSKVFTYGANVTSGISSQNIEVTADTNAKVYVNGVAATNVTGTFTSNPVQFQPGKNTVEVKVVAQDGKTSQSYTVEVTRAVVGGSADVKLNSVTLSAGTLSGFNPTLATAQSLTTFVPNEVKELTVTPVGNHANATIVVTTTGTNTDLKVEKQGSSYVVKNLTDSTTLTNQITIKVVAEDGTTTVSNTFGITRATATASDVANLTALNIQSVVNNFVSTTTEYAGKVANGTGTVGTITATAPNGSFVTYEVNGINYGTDLFGSSTTAKTAAEAAVLKLGANTAKITVTSANAKNSRAYTVTLDRADVGSSIVKTLNSITTTTGTITGFTADQAAPAGGLKVNVPNATTEFTFKPTATHAKATVSVTAAKGSTNVSISASAATTDKLDVVKNADGSFTVKGLQTLSAISNVAVITVTAEDASTATYNLQIDRATVSASDNALLTGFTHDATVSGTVSSGTFTGTVSNITIPSSQNVVYIKPTATVGAGATVLVDGKPVNATGVSAPISVAVGETKAVVVKVTAANGTTTKEYTVNVKRAVENASVVNTLSGLTLSSGLLNGFVASDQVNNTGVAIDTTVSAATENLTITPALKDAGSTVSVVASTGSSYTAASALTVEKSGDAYTIKGLVGGSTANTVVITVTSASGATKAYTLKVTRAIAGVSTDSALANAGLTLTPSTAGAAGTAIDATTATSPFDFKGAAKEYTVYTTNGVDKVNFTATEKVEGQTFTAKVNGQAVPVDFTNNPASLTAATIATELVRGQNNKVEITVTAPDAATSTTYTVNVVSAASGASAVATLKATPFTNVSPNVTISSTGTNTYSTATIDGNIASFKFKPEFTNAESRAVVSIGSTFYKPDADGVYTVDAATGTTAVKVTVVAGDNSNSTAYTLNIVKDASSLDLTAANAAKTAATTALSAYTTAGGLNTATVYTDVTTAVTALETAITSASATDIAAKTTALTTATTALTTATTVLTQGTALATALGYVNAAVPTLTGTTVTLPTTGGVTWTKGGGVVTTDTVSYGSSATTIEYVATATVSGQTATKTHTLTVPAKAVASVIAPTVASIALGTDNAAVLSALATTIGNVTVSNNDGTSGTVAITVANLSTTDTLTTAGAKTIKVTVDGKEVTFTVTLTS